MASIQERGGGKKRIVIVGAGFAGLYTYLGLHELFHNRDDVFITIINKNDYFVFKPMIHEVAIGNLLPGSITQSIRSLPECCLDDFVEGEVTEIDFDRKQITYLNQSVSDEHSDHIKGGLVSYDYLVLATGSKTNFFGVEGAEKYCMTMNDLEDARKIKNHILNRFEEAQLVSEEDKKKQLLTFIIVGGGPSGVELAGEMGDILNGELRKIYPELYPLSSIHVVQGGAQLISVEEEWFAKKTQEILEAKGKVRVLLNSRVSKVDESGVWVGDTHISGGTVIWTAGVTANNTMYKSSKEISLDERSGRVKTNRALSLPSHEHVFAIGDIGWVPHRDDDTKAYPTRAQFAVKQGVVAARNIFNMVEGNSDRAPFHAEDKGFIVSLGKGGALARLFGMRFSGFIAWWIYRTAYLSKIFGARAKARTALEWTLNLFTDRDLSEI